MQGEVIRTIKKVNTTDKFLSLGGYNGSFRILSGKAVLRDSNGSIVKNITSSILYNYKEGSQGIDISEGSVTIGFTGKYKIGFLELNGLAGFYESNQIPLKNLKYFSNCGTLALYGNIGFGNLIDAADAIQINKFFFNNKGNTSYITGDLDEFALAQVTYGKTSGTTTIYTNDKITYNGEVQNSGTEFIISYNSTYPNGYTIAKTN